MKRSSTNLNNSEKRIINLSSLCLMVFAFFALSFNAHAQKGQDMKDKKMNNQVMKMKKLAPAKDYVMAHKDIEEPFELLGGPIEVKISQSSGGVFVGLPDKRKLDPAVFGTPEHPRAFGGSPAVTGLPLMMREVEGGEFTVMKKPSPFGDKHMVMPNGELSIDALDATATDAAKSDDKVMMQASWEDKEGNKYEVKCCEQLATHGMEYPTFGGVVTNTIMHGFTNIGTPLMPSEFTYFAFWGMGEILKNGETLEKPRLIHGMLTEYVRTEGYKLAMDKEVTPTKRQFHLMVPPFMPDKENMSFKKSPVETGLNLPNGMELPFWHVMFENLDIQSNRK